MEFVENLVDSLDCYDSVFLLLNEKPLNFVWLVRDIVKLVKKNINISNETDKGILV